MHSQTFEGFKKIFGKAPTHRLYSPGRVNLIGEHTDYSGGMVFPMALSIGINGAYKKRDDGKIRLYSSTFEELGVLTVELNDLRYKKGFSFGNYVQGVLSILKSEGYTLSKGFDLYLDSSLPASAGLSSSAALEMAVLSVVDSLEGYNLEGLEAVKLARKVENDYMGIASGIMDQFAVRFGKRNHAIFLNTQTLEYAYAPFELKHHTLFMMNTNKKRNLETSDYNERFDSVKAGMDRVKALLKVESLGEVSTDQFDEISTKFESEQIKRRIRHVVNENDRTKKAYEALKNNDYPLFGTLMDASHSSLKNDFEVSCDELDYLVEQNKRLGALGARMTGAGFGGTMIALYENSDVPDSFDTLKEDYEKRFNKPLNIYQASSSDGVYSMKEAD